MNHPAHLHYDAARRAAHAAARLPQLDAAAVPPLKLTYPVVLTVGGVYALIERVAGFLYYSAALNNRRSQ